jgi:para-nitrobenzyl esterase
MSNEVVVTIQLGKLEGLSKEGIFTFKGIPYASPPIGEKRWLPPQPMTPWNGVREAKKVGNVAPQNMSDIGPLQNKELLAQEVHSEDCLFLNIWSPGLDNKKRPVMFWIHGGGFSTGAGSRINYNGEKLTKRGDVVVVTINYRLGALGFLNLNEITGGKIPSTGNEGLLDQIAALKWVKNNISAFGGDPNNVTIFGESAGSMSVATLLALPAAKGLFHKAICESGGASSVHTTDKAKAIAGLLLDSLGLKNDDIEGMRAMPFQKIMAAQVFLPQKISRAGIGAAMSFQPVLDGKIMPDMPLKLIANGSSKSIPILVGSNMDEWALLSLTDTGLATLDDTGLERRLERLIPREYTASFIKAYRDKFVKRGKTGTSGDIFCAVQTDRMFWIPAAQLLTSQRAQNDNVFSYLFTWESPAQRGKLGACHAVEIGFVFGTNDAVFSGTGSEADALSQKVQDAWLSFARTGNPSCKSLGDWPRFGKHRETMSLGKECFVAKEPFKEIFSLWQSLPPSVTETI